MQLHFEADEINLLANLLMLRSSPQNEKLLEMVLRRNLRFDSDDLDALADLLAAERCSLKDEIAKVDNAVRRVKLVSTLALLERVLERVDEACVMI